MKDFDDLDDLPPELEEDENEIPTENNDNPFAPPEPVEGYTAEDHKNALDLRTPHASRVLVEQYIPGMSASPGYKKALALGINSVVSVDKLLANLTPTKTKSFFSSTYNPLELQKAYARQIMNKTYFAMTKTDTKKTWYGNIDDAIHTIVIDITSRAYGPQRERIMNPKKVSSVEQTNITEKRDQLPEPQKKGNKIFGR